MPRVALFAVLGYDGESNPAFLDIEHRVSRVPLREDYLFLRKGHDFPTLADGGKEFLRVEVAPIRARFGWWPQRFSKLRKYTPPNVRKILPMKYVQFCTQLEFLTRKAKCAPW